MSTGYLGNRSGQSDQQIGDITLSYNQTNAAGNALLKTNGAILDAKKYPLLAAKLSSQLELETFKLAHHFDGQEGDQIAQSDDGEYCFVSSGRYLRRFKKSAPNSMPVVLDVPNGRLLRCACSADGRYVVAAAGWTDHNGTGQWQVYYSNNYGDSFSLWASSSLRSQFGQTITFISRSGKNMLVMGVYIGGRAEVFWSADFGETWTKNTNAREGNFHACREDLSKIWVTSNGRLKASTDFGETWTIQQTGLPDRQRDIAIDATNNDVMLASFADRAEIYLSENGGDDWRGIPDPRLQDVRTIKIHNGVITLIVMISGQYVLLISDDLGQNWLQSDVLGGKNAAIDPRIALNTTNYAVRDHDLLSTKATQITRLPLGNLNSERIIADKVV